MLNKCDWISVKDRIPRIGRKVLIRKGKVMSVGKAMAYSDGRFYGFYPFPFPCCNDEQYNSVMPPTHWMPLPKIDNAE